ncbi:Imm32 family immunity protein [Streptomyces decoyicus]
MELSLEGREWWDRVEIQGARRVSFRRACCVTKGRRQAVMDLVISVPDCRVGEGLQFTWDDGFEIELEVGSTEVVLRANRAGLASLARHLLTLAQQDVHSTSVSRPTPSRVRPRGHGPPRAQVGGGFRAESRAGAGVRPEVPALVSAVLGCCR